MSGHIKSPVPYFGGKQMIAPWIVSLLPDHDHYVEPFCGGLSVLLAKQPSRMETVNDLDGRLVTFWRVLRDRPEELIKACALTPHARTEFLAAYGDETDDLEVARRVWLTLIQGRSGTLRESRTGWRRHVTANGNLVPPFMAVSLERMAAAAERLRGVSLECADALEIIAEYGRSDRVLLYVDPPYVGDVRARGYRHEMADAEQHRKLAIAFSDCKATVVLSGYSSPLYDELYDGWHRYARATHTGNAKSDKARTEVLWANRPLGDRLDLFATP